MRIYHYIIEEKEAFYIDHVIVNYSGPSSINLIIRKNQDHMALLYNFVDFATLLIEFCFYYITFIIFLTIL